MQREIVFSYVILESASACSYKNKASCIFKKKFPYRVMTLKYQANCTQTTTAVSIALTVDLCLSLNVNMG